MNVVLLDMKQYWIFQKNKLLETDIYDEQLQMEDDKYIYIRNLILDDIELILTVRSSSSHQSNSAQNMLLKMGLNIVLTVGQLENASIQLSKNVQYHYYDKQTNLVQFILAHYKNQLNYSLGKLFLSFDFMGNTAQIIDNLKTGFQQIIIDPTHDLK